MMGKPQTALSELVNTVLINVDRGCGWQYHFGIVANILQEDHVIEL